MPFQENIATYFKIYQNLKVSIFSGEFEKGSKIVSRDELAKNYGVASETMRKAINLLVAEGLLIRKKGIGTLIPENADLSPLEMGKLIGEKKVMTTFLESKVEIYSAEWVVPSRRFVQLFNLDPGTSESNIYKVFFRMDFGEKYNRRLRGLMTHCLSQDMFRELGATKNMKPYDVLKRVGNWIDTKPIKLIETIQPLWCVDENAKLLDLPDGTPAFYQEFVLKPKSGPTFFFSFISNANMQKHETEINQTED
ncbi:MAG: GntR family transcriptional regulator [Syntrophobacteraceae bacterium]